MGIRTLQEN